MKYSRAIAVLAATLLSAGCQTGHQSTGTQYALNRDIYWYVLPVPADLPWYGSPSQDRARVIIYGEVHTPGVYFVPTGATVEATAVAAGGLTDFVSWNHSGIVKPRGKFKRFNFRHRMEDEKILMQDGDALFISRMLE